MKIHFSKLSDFIIQLPMFLFWIYMITYFAKYINLFIILSYNWWLNFIILMLSLDQLVNSLNNISDKKLDKED